MTCIENTTLVTSEVLSEKSLLILGKWLERGGVRGGSCSGGSCVAMVDVGDRQVS